jgi:hypothetical protein
MSELNVSHQEIVRCLICDSVGEYLGDLARLSWFKCCCCGLMFNQDREVE